MKTALAGHNSRFLQAAMPLVEAGAEQTALLYHRAMPKPQNPKGTIEVDGEHFEWNIVAGPRWSSERGWWTGMKIAVKQTGMSREAVLEFPKPPGRWAGSGVPNLRRPPQVNAQTIAQAIRAAIAAGWEPTSRGKAVVIALEGDCR